MRQVTMQDMDHKSITLLISKLMTAIAVSQRSHDEKAYTRREKLKDELVARGPAALPELLDVLRKHDDVICQHMAEIIGYIGSDEAIIPLAKILAEPYPPFTKQCAAKALKSIRSPEAIIALNIWNTRMEIVQAKLQGFIQNNTGDPITVARLNQLAEKHRTTPERIADAWLLITTRQSLSLEAQQRLNALRLTPEECNYIEEIANPSKP